MHIDWVLVLHCVSTSSVTSHYLCRGFLRFLQLPVRVEHSCVAMDNASDLLTVVMGLENALMAVMRLDVVSNHSGLAFIITAIAYRVEVNLNVFSLVSQL